MTKVAIAGGRFNPPTRGHAVLIQQLVTQAQHRGVAAEVFVVDGEKSSQDKTRNPLTADQRLRILRQWFPTVRFDVVSSAHEIMDVLAVQDKQPLLWLAGSDRTRKYRSLLLHEGHTEAQVVEVDRSSGEADGVSATLARQAALRGDLQGFRQQLPLHVLDHQLEHIMSEIKQAVHHDHTSSTGPHILPSG